MCVSQEDIACTYNMCLLICLPKAWGTCNLRLITLCCWAQQSKVVDKVLKAQFQTFQPMHTYDFLIMVNCFLGCGLLNDSLTVKKSIICIPIVIYTHTRPRSIINSSLLGVNIEVTDHVAIHTSKFLHGVIILSMHWAEQDPKAIGSWSLIHTLTFS